MNFLKKLIMRLTGIEWLQKFEQQQKAIINEVHQLRNFQHEENKRIYLQQMKTQMTLDYLIVKNNQEEFCPVEKVDNKRPISDLYKTLQEMVPAAYEKWIKLFDNNVECYQGFPVHSCSVQGHAFADLFKHYVALYLRGRVLDIGCGPQPKPLYLEEYPNEMIAGIDPIEAAHPFEFVQGLAEFLPWKAEQFETVICGTSLDHVLLLHKVFEDINRVLTDGGRFITWVAFVTGAKKYNPYHDEIIPIDNFHLFHFDKPWFEDMVGKFFEIEHCMHFDWPMISSFYVLKKKRFT